jgi:transcription elongation GreA/GreB family factor
MVNNALELKAALYRLCNEALEQRIANAEAIIEDAREAARNETKSSAGDKYETAREMMQQDIDMNNARIAEARAERLQLQQVDVTKVYTIAQPGSLVVTDRGNYFIAISCGKLQLDDIVYMCISARAPIALVMKGSKPGDSFSFNGTKYTVGDIL